MIRRLTDNAWVGSEHPRLYVALRSRTRAFGTLNLAYSLLGRSTGWGEGKPRRWFVGRHRGRQPSFHRGIELVVRRDPSGRGMGTEHTLLKIPLGSGSTTWRTTGAWVKFLAPVLGPVVLVALLLAVWPR